MSTHHENNQNRRFPSRRPVSCHPRSRIPLPEQVGRGPAAGAPAAGAPDTAAQSPSPPGRQPRSPAPRTSPARRCLLPLDLPSAPGKAMLGLGQGRAPPPAGWEHCQKPAADEAAAEGGAAPARCRRSPLPHSADSRPPRYRSAAPPLPRPFMAAAAPGRRSPLAAPPAPPERPAASWAAASRPGAAPQQVEPGTGGRRARGRRAQAPAGRGASGVRRVGGVALPRPALARAARGPLTVALAGRDEEGRALCPYLCEESPARGGGGCSAREEAAAPGTVRHRANRGCTCGDGSGGGRGGTSHAGLWPQWEPEDPREAFLPLAAAALSLTAAPRQKSRCHMSPRRRGREGAPRGVPPRPGPGPPQPV